MNAVWIACIRDRPDILRPFGRRTSSAAAASVMHERTGFSVQNSVQAPQTPCSHPTWVPVRRQWSRTKSASESRSSTSRDTLAIETDVTVFMRQIPECPQHDRPVHAPIGLVSRRALLKSAIDRGLGVSASACVAFGCKLLGCPLPCALELGCVAPARHAMSRVSDRRSRRPPSTRQITRLFCVFGVAPAAARRQAGNQNTRDHDCPLPDWPSPARRPRNRQPRCGAFRSRPAAAATRRARSWSRANPRPDRHAPGCRRSCRGCAPHDRRSARDMAQQPQRDIGNLTVLDLCVRDAGADCERVALDRGRAAGHRCARCRPRARAARVEIQHRTERLASRDHARIAGHCCSASKTPGRASGRL